MIALLLDQGLPASAARDLRTRGWDVVHVSERGLSRATDLEILALAASESRAVATLDADFPMLVALGLRARPSVIHIRIQPMPPSVCVALLVDVIARVADDLHAGAIISVKTGGVRIRRLPVERDG